MRALAGKRRFQRPFDLGTSRDLLPRHSGLRRTLAEPVRSRRLRGACQRGRLLVIEWRGPDGDCLEAAHWSLSLPGQAHLEIVGGAGGENFDR